MIDNTDSMAPRARSSGLVVRELEDEVLIFDVERNQAHCLNGTAGLVWKLCDGRNSVEEIRDQLEQELSAPVSAEIVWKALTDLDDDHLLDEAAEVSPTSRMSRKDLMKRAGATVAVPVIASLVIPSVAFATGSVGACGATCQHNSDCTKADVCNNTCAHAGNGCPAGNTCVAQKGETPPNGCSGTAQNCVCVSGKCNGTVCA